MAYHVYVMSSLSRCLYVGVTRDLVRRVWQHRHRFYPAAFSGQYNTRRLVYFETSQDVWAAIAREKELKGWRRAKKVALIERGNPGWRDLAARWPDIDLPRGYG